MRRSFAFVDSAARGQATPYGGYCLAQALLAIKHARQVEAESLHCAGGFLQTAIRVRPTTPFASCQVVGIDRVPVRVEVMRPPLVYWRQSKGQGFGDLDRCRLLDLLHGCQAEVAPSHLPLVVDLHED